jgi:hypothetical protein
MGERFLLIGAYISHMAKSMIGARRGKLIILEVLGDGSLSKRGPLYKCQCDCGVVCEVYGKNLSAKRKNRCPECSGNNDLSGKRSGKLTIIKKDGMIGHSIAYQCICDCGKSYRGTSCGLRKGVLKSCGCGRYDKSMILDPDRRKVLLDKEYKNMLRRNEDELGFPPSDLSFNDFRYISSLDCFYCGRPPSNKTMDGYKGHYQSDYALIWMGIDRLNSNFGYMKSNIVPACGTCNKMKSNLTLEEFDELTETYHQYHE